MKNSKVSLKLLTPLKLLSLWLAIAAVNSSCANFVHAAPASTLPATTQSAVAVELVYWDSNESLNRLSRADIKQPFFILSNYYEPQSNKLFCGPTTATIVLNALRLKNEDAKKPVDSSQIRMELTKNLPANFNPAFERYTQYTFFNPKTDEVKTLAELMGKPMTGMKTSDIGLQLRQLDQMLIAHGLSSNIQVVDADLEVSYVRDQITSALKKDKTYVIVNYFRPALGQKGAGHISPLGAYDAQSDSFLILDVNPNAAKWAWVKTSDLVNAMRTKDGLENRGYLIVSEDKGEPKN